MGLLIVEVKTREVEIKRQKAALLVTRPKEVLYQWPVPSHLIQAQGYGWTSWKDSGISSLQTQFPRITKLKRSLPTTLYRLEVKERYKFCKDLKQKAGETIQELASRIRHDAVRNGFQLIKDPLDEP